MERLLAALISLLLLAGVGVAQKQSPSQTVVAFYRALKEKRYVEGFRHSVYRGAVEGLTPAELQDLESEFARTFSEIPDKIEPKGEQIDRDTATVFLKFEGVDGVQQVALIRVAGEWLVGDQDSLALVRKQGREFFFNTRMDVNEDEVYEALSRLLGAEFIYAQKFAGNFTTLSELVRLGALPKDLEAGESTGYKFALTLSDDKKSFYAVATPSAYGKTGRLSFYVDIGGVRAEDLKGQPASEKSPLYHSR